jgi:hypothetical protein
VQNSSDALRAYVEAVENAFKGHQQIPEYDSTALLVALVMMRPPPSDTKKPSNLRKWLEIVSNDYNALVPLINSFELLGRMADELLPRC